MKENRWRHLMTSQANKVQGRGKATRDKIELAISRIRLKRPKIVAANREISIAAVAEEAQVSRANIYNSYPDLAVKIRRLSETKNRSHSRSKNGKLIEERKKSQNLRAELDDLRRKNQQLCSINASLMFRIQQLELENASENIITLAQKD